MRKRRDSMAADARKFVRVQITRKGEIRLREGHPWVYDTEVVSLEAPCEDGSLVEVVLSLIHI